MDAPVSTILLENIFFPGGPLHDGAVIVRGDTISAASCIFPLTTSPGIQRRLGTRHRAAMGLAEETDAIAIVVSEETGRISLAAGRDFIEAVPYDQLETRLRELMRTEKLPEEKA
jgi:diadenylate cyclase